MLLRGLVVLVVAASSLSCGVCTLVACRSSVAVTLAAAERERLLAGPAEIRLCIDSTCTQGAFAGNSVEDFELQGSLLSVYRDDAATIDQATVSLTISSNGVERFSRTWPNVRFAGRFPNGPGCGEGCRVVAVDASTL